MIRPSSLLAGLGALALTLASSPSLAQSCYTVVAYVAPNPLRCQEVGRDQLGRPIWLCC